MAQSIYRYNAATAAKNHVMSQTMPIYTSLDNESCQINTDSSSSSSPMHDKRLTSDQHPYKIVDIAHFMNDNNVMGKLSISISPGKKDIRWNRNLQKDLYEMREKSIQVIVCLLEWSEMKMLGIADYPRKSQEAGFLFYHLPIRDKGVPDQNEIDILIPTLVNHLMMGQNVLIHCREGLGRAGTICACCLTHFGYKGKDAIRTIRQRRPGAIQTNNQERCVLNYHRRLISRS